MPNELNHPSAEVNPYAAPLSEEALVAQVVDEPDMWRDGPTLVVPRKCVLPNRCVKCNAPAQRRLVRRLYWHHPAYYLIIFVSLLIYVIVALIVRQKAVIDVGLCARHHAKRRRSIIIGWLGLLGCIAGLVVAILFGRDYPWLFWACPVLVLSELVYAVIVSRFVAPTRIDGQYAWLKNLHPDFLAEFPLLSGARPIRR